MGADPVTLGIIAVSLTAAATATTTYGQYRQGQAMQNQAKYQAQVAENNSVLASRAADDARSRGDAAANEHRRRVQQLIGTQRTGAAARGVLVDEGSALEQTVDTANLGEFDALMIRHNAEREALGYEQQGANFLGEQQLAVASGRNARTEALLNSTSTLIGGSSTVADKWYRLRTGP